MAAAATVAGAATRLPYHILLDCFELVCSLQDEMASSSTHGGKLVGWQSNESALPLTLVCRAWYEAARDLLYRSVAILNSRATDQFLRTARNNPRLIDRVRYLVIGLGDEDVSPELGDTAGRVSLRLVNVITVCNHVRHLQIRPLHESARAACMSAILSKQLLSLVCSPRLCRPDVGWTTEFFRKTDIDELALPTLHALELDAWTTPFDPPILVIPHFSACPIVNLRLHFVIPDTHLFALLAASGPTLEVVDLYFEHVLPLQETVTALMASYKTMRNFRYVSNPTVDELLNLVPTASPLFDQLLPRFEKIERLCVSATDISTNSFRHLPPSLKILDIVSFNHQGAFVASSNLLDILHDRSITFELTHLTLSDSADGWEMEYIETLRKAFLARGITFVFVPDPVEQDMLQH